MKLFPLFLLISSTCFASSPTKFLSKNEAECASLRNLKGTKINCLQEFKASPALAEANSEREMAGIEEEMGPPPEALSEEEDLILE